MTGYCRLCGLRLDAPNSPALTPHGEQIDVCTLGLLSWDHLKQYHSVQWQQLVVQVAQFQALAGLFLVHLPPGADVQETQAGRELRERRAAVVQGVVDWITSPEPVQVRKVQPAAPGLH